MSELMVVDDLRFELRRSARRKSIGVTVDRDGTLLLHAPVDCPMEAIEQVARQQQGWIYAKLARKRALVHERPVKEYVSGEGFLYLGRSYRLLLVTPGEGQDTMPPLRLQGGRFLLRRDERDRAEAHFVAWYAAQGGEWLGRHVRLLAEQTGVAPHGIDVRDLHHRWGLCLPDDRVAFHWRTLQLPPRIIMYIVVHELAHLLHPNHGPEFWRCIARVLPDWAARAQWLEEHGARY